MFARNIKDALGGGLLLAFGAFVALYALAHYPVGTPNRMGPGMFPVALGCLIGAMGLALLIQARARPADAPKFRIWIPIVISLAIGTFALTIRPFGLVPAVIGTILVSALAERDVRPVSLLALCAVVGLLVWLVFIVGLGLPIPAFRWPF